MASARLVFFDQLGRPVGEAAIQPAVAPPQQVIPRGAATWAVYTDSPLRTGPGAVRDSRG